jgi:zinc protease
MSSLRTNFSAAGAQLSMLRSTAIRSSILRVAFAGLVLFATILPAFAQYTTWQQIPIPALPPFKPQEPKRIQLGNGMIVFLQEDHELPLIDAVARIRGGAISEPAAKAGLVDLYGEVWRTGGTKSQTGDQLDDYLEIRAARVETSGGADSTNVSLSCLKGDFDDVFKIFVELLRNPEFRADKLDLAQQGAYDSISRRNDSPGQIVSREAAKLAYGKGNPYAREAEYASIAAVTREDLLNWHKTYVHPNNIIFGIAGDFDSAAMEAKLRAAFDSWPKGPAAAQPKIDFTPTKPGYYLVKKEDVNQSNVRMVTLGTERKNPDYFAIEVFNEAFGGGFSSRLTQDIRTKRGLAYSVGGGVGTAYDHPGVTRMALGTKSQTTIEAIQALLDDINDLKKNPINADEIKKAKDSILNSFIFNLDSPDKVLRERMAYEFYGYPADFLEKYRAGIEKVMQPDVARVAEKYVQVGKFALLVVGNPAEFDKPLSTLGPVTDLDITIPGAPPNAPGESGSASGADSSSFVAPTASNAAGKALAAKAAAAIAPPAKLKSIRGLHTSLQEEGEPPILVTIAFPDRMHVSIAAPGGDMTVVATPTAGFMGAQGQVKDLPGPRKQEMLDQIKRDLVYIAQHADDSSFFFAANGTEKIGDVTAQILDINSQGAAMRWYVDPASGRILREIYPAMGQSGPVLGQTELSDWKSFDGVMLPAKHANRQNGKDIGMVEFTEISFNPPIDDKLFAKPAAQGQ